MLNRMISFALRNRLLVALLALGVAVYGTVVSVALPIDVLPDLNRPTVTILTEAHGLVPEDIQVQNSVQKRTPFSEAAPDSIASTYLRKLVDQAEGLIGNSVSSSVGE